MRHRAPTPLVRLLRTAPARRGIAAGAVLLLGASSGVYLAVSDDAASRGDSGVAAGAPVEERDGTSYPGAVAMEAIRATRTPLTTRGGDREPLPGQARPRLSDRVSAPVVRTPAAPATSTTQRTRPSSPSGSSGPAAGAEEPTASSDPTREAPQPTTRPTSSPAEPEPSPPSSAQSTPSSAPTGPETTAATQVAAAGTWTVALASNSVGASFQCSLDGAAYTACPPVATFVGLRQGPHTLSARAVDTAGTTDPTPVLLTTDMTGVL